jgi:hypothetical protein
MFDGLSKKKYCILLKIAILTRSKYGSPRILAESLQIQLSENGIDAGLLFDIDVLSRLVSYRDSKLSFHFWLQKKITHWFSDRRVMQALKQVDAVIISECIPNAYWKRLYNVPKLKAIIKKQVFIYEVYWLGNAPTQIAALQNSGDELNERYDGHLFISPVTEIRAGHLSNTFCIGLLAKTWNLQPLPKKDLLALVDFVQPGYEAYREMQISNLQKAGIPFIALEKRLTIVEIRDIYRKACLYFMSSFEAFGLPILECLCCGAQVFTPDSGWPMSWRLDKAPWVHGSGNLPGCFTVYKEEDDLLEKLLIFKKNYNPVETPVQVFNGFIKHYPAFYEGNQLELERFLDFIKMRIN